MSIFPKAESQSGVSLVDRALGRYLDNQGNLREALSLTFIVKDDPKIYTHSTTGENIRCRAFGHNCYVVGCGISQCQRCLVVLLR